MATPGISTPAVHKIFYKAVGNFKTDTIKKLLTVDAPYGIWKWFEIERLVKELVETEGANKYGMKLIRKIRKLKKAEKESQKKDSGTNTDPQKTDKKSASPIAIFGARSSYIIPKRKLTTEDQKSTNPRKNNQKTSEKTPNLQKSHDSDNYQQHDFPADQSLQTLMKVELVKDNKTSEEPPSKKLKLHWCPLCIDIRA